MDKPDRLHSFGEFRIGERSIFGELKLDERKTNLKLHSHEYIQLRDVADRYIPGELPDKTKLSLIDCNVPPVPGSLSSETGRSYLADIFPHFVVSGRRHVNPEDKSVSAIYWHLPDLSAAFYDFDAFASSVNPERFIDAIVAEQEQVSGRKIQTGPIPEIQYFTGLREIFSCDTDVGAFSVHHAFQQNFGGPPGIWMKNRMRAALRFGDQVKFRDAISAAYRLSTFLSIVVGRPQSIEDIDIEVAGEMDQPPLRVFPSLPVRYENPEGRFDPGPSDVLLDGMRRPAEFATMLKHWFATNAEMATPRGRFWDSFKKQNFYDADRIIAAANLFDTIPSSHYPKKIQLTADILDAAKEAKALFKPLPKSHERETILRELSNIDKPRLRTKVKHWAAQLIEHHGDQYEDLGFVIDQAVKCRNFYVHGGKAEFDYNQEFGLFMFLTRTLEFCYIAPEFLCAGWSLADWRKQCGNFHPFDEYRQNYGFNLNRLHEAIAPAGC